MARSNYFSFSDLSPHKEHTPLTTPFQRTLPLVDISNSSSSLPQWPFSSCFSSLFFSYEDSMSIHGFWSVWSIQPHFHLIICRTVCTCYVYVHISFFLILSGQWMFTMIIIRRHLFAKDGILLSVVFVVLHVSDTAVLIWCWKFYILSFLWFLSPWSS